jgi:hypothetical protein
MEDVGGNLLGLGVSNIYKFKYADPQDFTNSLQGISHVWNFKMLL